MTLKLSWGILGAGNISSQFAHDLVVNNVDAERTVEHTIVAIGCSSTAKGDDFIKTNGISAGNNNGIVPVSQNYDDFFANKDIDIVYIGTPHVFHKDQVKQALNNDKHVLVEKPITVNAKDAEELFALAHAKHKFLMEAVWTRFFPSVKLIKQHLFEYKTLGDYYKLFADFSMYCDFEELPATSRGRDIKLGAGATLDIGIYSVTYGRILLDEKVGNDASSFETKSLLTLDPVDHVDHESTIIIKYQNGKQGILTSSNHTGGPQAFVRINGTDATLEMWSDNPARPKNFKITFSDPSKDPIVFEEVNDYNGFIYEANAVAQDISDGKIENSTMPWSETLLVMGIMDKARKENGLVYPQDV